MAFPPILSDLLFQMMEDEDLLVQYGLLDGEGEGQTHRTGAGPSSRPQRALRSGQRSAP